MSEFVLSEMKLGDLLMMRINAYYFYLFATNLHPVSTITSESKLSDVRLRIMRAYSMLDSFLHHSVFQVKTSRQKGEELFATLKKLNFERGDREIGFQDFYALTDGLTQFETVLASEFSIADVYLVTKKRGYDLSELIENAIVLFPEDLPRKVPEAVADINQAGRCLAFELPTAAGFHLHRANESVFHKYYDAVTSGKPRPNGRNIGDYLNALNNLGVGDSKVKSAMKDLKDLHRNPLIHPQDSLESVDEAIALMGIIQSVIVHMLKVIPGPTP